MAASTGIFNETFLKAVTSLKCNNTLNTGSKLISAYLSFIF